MVAARSAAMGFNRLADQAIDARNPRTAGRELPRGVLSRGEVWAFVRLSAGALVVAACAAQPALPRPLARRPRDRLRLLVHEALHGAPRTSCSACPWRSRRSAAWLAIRGPLRGGAAGPRGGRRPLGGGLRRDLRVPGRWSSTAAEGLHSIPARLGVPRALVLARALHVGAIVLLIALYRLAPLHPLYLVGVAVVAGLLAWEHTLVRPDDLSRVMQAFNLNGWVSLGYFAFTAAAAWLA